MLGRDREEYCLFEEEEEFLDEEVRLDGLYFLIDEGVFTLVLDRRGVE
jgi:hypothetical protein